VLNAVANEPNPMTNPKCKKIAASCRSVLNGMAINRAKYTTYSRHYTSHEVLRKIAAYVQPLLQAGDTFVDFSCGYNSFAPLLRNPLTGTPLPSVSFDVISPGEHSHNFVRKNWLAVDVQKDLPPGELIVGLNPPFGFLNRMAIDFVNHACCARPRLLVLIMPSTNFQPPFYELIHRDEELCRGSVFYAPGSGSSNWINAHNVAPLFLVYRRIDAVGEPPGCRVGFCHHFADHKRQMAQKRREIDINEELQRKRARYAEIVVSQLLSGQID